MSASADELSFWGHIGVLRNYFILGGVIFVLLAGLAYTFENELLLPLLFKPLHGEQVLFLSPLGPFLFRISISLYAAVAAAFPFWLVLLFRFIAPALTRHQQRALAGFGLFSILLGAVSLAITGLYFVPTTLQVLQGFAMPGAQSLLTAESYLSFCLLELAVVFVVLQIPIILIALSYVRLINPAVLARHRRFAIIGIVSVLAIVTPTTDAVTLIIVSVPAVLLWEVGIAISRMIYTRK